MSNNGVYATSFFWLSALVANFFLFSISISILPFNIPFLFILPLGVHKLLSLGAEGIPSPTDLLLTISYLL